MLIISGFCHIDLNAAAAPRAFKRALRCSNVCYMQKERPTH